MAVVDSSKIEQLSNEKTNSLRVFVSFFISMTVKKIKTLNRQ